MHKSVKVITLLMSLLLISFTPLQKDYIHVYLIGDSKVADYANNYDSKEYMKTRYPVTGWGQVFQPFLSVDSLSQLSHIMKADSVIVVDKARGGRSTRTFFEEGRWAEVYKALQKNDLVLIQFGHNDAAENKPERYVNIQGYKEYLRLYVNQTREKGAYPILLTPVNRNYPWKDGKLSNVHEAYPQAVKDVANELNVPLIDLTQLSIDFFTTKGEAYVTNHYFMNLPAGVYEAYQEGQRDNTHFQPEGATEVARLVFQGIKALDGKQNPGLTYDMVVAKDGSGDYQYIQDAINACRAFTPKRLTIFIKNGVYKEKLLIPSWITDISLIGESVDSTIITYDDHAGRGKMGTFDSYSVKIEGNDIYVENITIENSAGPVGQAVALHVEGDRCIFRNCRFLGFQDTMFASGENSRQYFADCYIEGTTDFIFGPATAVFEDCVIHSKKNSYITAASTPQWVNYGYVFIDCKFTADPDVDQVYLGRPWRDHARTVLINSEMGDHILPEGWHNWSRPEAEKTTFYAEYNSKGLGANPAARVSWAHQLNEKMLKNYTLDTIFNGWKPKIDSFTGKQ